MKHLRVLVAHLLNRLANPSWSPCPICGVRHDPREHYPLHDDTY